MSLSMEMAVAAPGSALQGASPDAQMTGASAPAELLKLRKAAGEFESMLLESLWKSMKETFSDPDDPDADPTLKNFDDWGMQAMSSAVGNSGGLGIKGLILKYLEPSITGSGPAAGPKSS